MIITINSETNAPFLTSEPSITPGRILNIMVEIEIGIGIRLEKHHHYIGTLSVPWYRIGRIVEIAQYLLWRKSVISIHVSEYVYFAFCTISNSESFPKLESNSL